MVLATATVVTALPNLVVVGNGMVGQRLLERLVERGMHRSWQVSVLGEEPRPAYDRVNLTGFFAGKTPAQLALAAPGFYAEHGIALHTNERAAAIDRSARTVTSTAGRTLPYDALVLATGSRPFVPPIPGFDLPGCFVYRTIEDLEAIRSWAATARVGAVIGGGLLGLEAADALRRLGLTTNVVEFNPRLMAVQIDDAGGAILRRKIEALGVRVHTGKSSSAVLAGEDPAGPKRVRALAFADKSELACDLVVFSAGIRPRDELAKACGLPVGERGGIVIDDACRTVDPAIFAIGECASHRGRCHGLVAPGYTMAEVAVDTLAGVTAAFTGYDPATKLKLLGIEVASFGDAHAATPGCHIVAYSDTPAEVYKKLVLSPDRRHLIGGVLVGDAASFGTLSALAANAVVLPPNPEDLILPQRAGAKPAGLGVTALPDAAQICSCHNVSKGAICAAIATHGLREVAQVKACTKAGSGCGSCVTLVKDLLKDQLKKAGVEVHNHVCEHFTHSRQELFHLVRVHGIRTFADLIARHGRGAGCEVCKPAVASILAACWNEYVLATPHLGLQDTNDRFLANLQRDGTYSVVPRVPGGEITPEQLITIGQVGRKYALYTKITGGQRIDLFGARLEQLPLIWRDLVDAGFESGHAYGKALRTVKSCVGETWCRYGVQDSTQLAIDLENRYKGLRSPHKLKSAVSGCARECAEAQSKDFGIIATENGWNLYLCGNGGMKPQHAQLFAADLDRATLIRHIDRFLMFYVRTADRLERTATWFNKLEGGMDYLRQVIIDDSLGIGAELEADMARVIGTYQCEWKSTIDDPEKLKRFRAFVNSDAADPSIVFVPERAQQRPARWAEKSAALQESQS